MLAIITKMTLTQVSTWFANARRRLKKDNKMTWSPRNRGEDDDDEADEEEEAEDNELIEREAVSSTDEVEKQAADLSQRLNAIPSEGN